MIQQLRKEQNLDVSDRIHVEWSSSDENVRAAFGEHSAYIMEQVLATEFVEGTPENAKTEELGAGTVTFGLSKV